MCDSDPPTDSNFQPDPKLFMGVLVQNYLNTLSLPFDVVCCVLQCTIAHRDHFWYPRGQYFYKNELNVTSKVYKCILDAIQHPSSNKN